jgi:hypothetical protein
MPRIDRESRKNLVVVRAGRNSLHPQWLDAGPNRNWDLIVSLYEAEAHFQHPEDVLIVTKTGGKWDGLHALFANSDLLRRYEYVWLPDDDIATSSSTIDAIFDMTRRYSLDLAQPALTRDSYFTHFALMSCPGFLLRYTNFVEIMAPCLKSSLLQSVLGDIQESMSGFGLDHIWCRLSHDNRFKAAIFDQLAVHHTRPLGRSLRGFMAKKGVLAKDEESQILARYNLRGRTRPLIYAAIDLQQKRRTGVFRLGIEMAVAYWSVLSEFKNQEGIGWKIVQILRRQFIRRLDLSQLQKCSPE